jgi:predicted Zn finger-like uncharacterized protein
MIEVKCPKCGAVYEVSSSQIGAKAVCEICGTEFIIKSMSPNSHIKRMNVPSKEQIKKIFRQVSRNGNQKDVEFITPIVLKYFQYILYILDVLLSVVSVIVVVMCPFFSFQVKISISFLIVCIGLPLSILLTRVSYEFMVAVFQIVYHLREIRDKIDES